MTQQNALVMKPQISVIIPLFDARIGEEDCVGSWVNQDDFAAEKYEILVISDGESPEMEERIRSVLRPGDRIERHEPRRYWDFTTRELKKRAPTCSSSPSFIVSRGRVA